MQQCTPTRDLNNLKLIIWATKNASYTTQFLWDCNESLLGMCVFFCTPTVGPFEALLPPNWTVKQDRILCSGDGQNVQEGVTVNFLRGVKGSSLIFRKFEGCTTPWLSTVWRIWSSGAKSFTIIIVKTPAIWQGMVHPISNDKLLLMQRLLNHLQTTSICGWFVVWKTKL